jgi:hypothetical protein
MEIKNAVDFIIGTQDERERGIREILLDIERIRREGGDPNRLFHTVKTRKEHKCGICGKEIPAGRVVHFVYVSPVTFAYGGHLTYRPRRFICDECYGEVRGRAGL